MAKLKKYFLSRVPFYEKEPRTQVFSIFGRNPMSSPVASVVSVPKITFAPDVASQEPLEAKQDKEPEEGEPASTFNAPQKMARTRSAVFSRPKIPSFSDAISSNHLERENKAASSREESPPAQPQEERLVVPLSTFIFCLGVPAPSYEKWQQDVKDDLIKQLTSASFGKKDAIIIKIAENLLSYSSILERMKQALKLSKGDEGTYNCLKKFYKISNPTLFFNTYNKISSRESSDHFQLLHRIIGEKAGLLIIQEASDTNGETMRARLDLWASTFIAVEQKRNSLCNSYFKFEKGFDEESAHLGHIPISLSEFKDLEFRALISDGPFSEDTIVINGKNIIIPNYKDLGVDTYDREEYFLKWLITMLEKHFGIEQSGVSAQLALFAALPPDHQQGGLRLAITKSIQAEFSTGQEADDVRVKVMSCFKKLREKEEARGFVEQMSYHAAWLSHYIANHKGLKEKDWEKIAWDLQMIYGCVYDLPKKHKGIPTLSVLQAMGFPAYASVNSLLKRVLCPNFFHNPFEPPLCLHQLRQEGITSYRLTRDTGPRGIVLFTVTHIKKWNILSMESAKSEAKKVEATLVIDWMVKGQLGSLEYGAEMHIREFNFSPDCSINRRKEIADQFSLGKGETPWGHYLKREEIPDSVSGKPEPLQKRSMTLSRAGVPLPSNKKVEDLAVFHIKRAVEDGKDLLKISFSSSDPEGKEKKRGSGPQTRRRVSPHHVQGVKFSPREKPNPIKASPSISLSRFLDCIGIPTLSYEEWWERKLWPTLLTKMAHSDFTAESTDLIILGIFENLFRDSSISSRIEKAQKLLEGLKRYEFLKEFSKQFNPVQFSEQYAELSAGKRSLLSSIVGEEQMKIIQEASRDGGQVMKIKLRAQVNHRLDEIKKRALLSSLFCFGEKFDCGMLGGTIPIFLTTGYEVVKGFSHYGFSESSLKDLINVNGENLIPNDNESGTSQAGVKHSFLAWFISAMQEKLEIHSKKSVEDQLKLLLGKQAPDPRFNIKDVTKSICRVFKKEFPELPNPGESAIKIGQCLTKLQKEKGGSSVAEHMLPFTELISKYLANHQGFKEGNWESVAESLISLYPRFHHLQENLKNIPLLSLLKAMTPECFLFCESFLKTTLCPNLFKGEEAPYHLVFKDSKRTSYNIIAHSNSFEVTHHKDLHILSKKELKAVIAIDWTVIGRFGSIDYSSNCQYVSFNISPECSKKECLSIMELFNLDCNNSPWGHYLKKMEMKENFPFPVHTPHG